jgi:hypothetical protein
MKIDQVEWGTGGWLISTRDPFVQWWPAAIWGGNEIWGGGGARLDYILTQNLL